MTLETAAAFAAMLTLQNTAQAPAPPGAWRLTPRERDLVTLVA